ncbi:hypothetical protein KAH27_10535 [bacterium]|nr:hypothetical protein [bacterium]
MKRFRLIAITMILATMMLSCDSPGTKAAKESMKCMEEAIENSHDMNDAREAIMDCQKMAKDKYLDELQEDEEFMNDFNASAKEFDSKLQKLLKEKLEDE